MGNKQSTGPVTNKSLRQSTHELANEEDSNAKLRIKRRLTNKSQNINRSSSSPIIAKCRFSTALTEQTSPTPPQQTAVVRSPLAISKTTNSNEKQKQQELNTAIQKIDSAQASVQHLNYSKLYKPNSFLLATSLSSKQDILPNKYELKSKNSSTLPNRHTTTTNRIEEEESKLKCAPKVVISSESNGSKSKTSNKLAKRFGLSPRFKRKIVETITNRVNSNSAATNHKFGQSRLLQALQSQWNIFTSISLSRNNLHKSDFENDDDDSFQRNKGRFEPTSTFLLNSVERNSFRYSSRRKYKTQSLANPYRHANTNYPVYIHEALFMPEFSVKGQVTEADFEILDVISRGAFGHVIKVKKKCDPNECDETNSTSDENQVYAMKIMWKSQVIRDRALQQVKDEVTIATSCVDNPLIVKTWFYWQSKRFLYIITDFVENGELLSLWLKVHHFPERLVAVYAIEMCLVLDYLHKRGIIYRDIKMENILLDQRGHIQLIDFGLSKWLKMGDRTCTICGTIQYMAPEILSVEPYDHSVDWWSLGILIYALLSGEYPLNAAKDHIQMNEKVSKHVFELDQSQGRYSVESCDLIRKLLRKNPQRRLKSLNEIKQDGFFLKELNNFIKSFAAEQGKSADEVTLLANENYWNPYFIIQNYSPLQLLFDEICSLKASKQKLEKSKLETPEKPKSRLLIPKTVASGSQQVKQTVSPEKQKPVDNSLSSSSASSASNCSDSATRTTTSIPNTSSDEIVEDIIESNEKNIVYRDDMDTYGDDENDYEDEENEYYDYDEHNGEPKTHGFTRF